MKTNEKPSAPALPARRTTAPPAGNGNSRAGTPATRAYDQLIKDWANGGITQQIAAAIARKILSGHLLSYAPLPSNQSLVGQWDTSTRTVIRAKALLAEQGILRRESGMYWVT